LLLLKVSYFISELQTRARRIFEDQTSGSARQQTTRFTLYNCTKNLALNRVEIHSKLFPLSVIGFYPL